MGREFDAAASADPVIRALQYATERLKAEQRLEVIRLVLDHARMAEVKAENEARQG